MGRISPGPIRWPPGAERRLVPAKSNLKPQTLSHSTTLAHAFFFFTLRITLRFRQGEGCKFSLPLSSWLGGAVGNLAPQKCNHGILVNEKHCLSENGTTKTVSNCAPYLISLFLQLSLKNVEVFYNAFSIRVVQACFYQLALHV